jgi:hypothetical protein
MIKGACHCGTVSFVLDEQPEWLTECNCSICRRIGAIWAHSAIANITIEAPPESTNAYIQGDKSLAIHTCKTCGCATHWESLGGDDNAHMAVNCRMIEPSILSDLKIRPFDGADTWTYLD